MGNQDLTTEMYEEHGVKFSYPADWTVEEQAGEEEIQIMVQSPDTAFWALNLYFERPAMTELIDSAIGTFREVYQEIDVARSEQPVGDHVGPAIDVDFLCLDLPTSAAIRTFGTDRFTGLVLAQYPEAEEETILPLLDQITQSIRCEEDLLGFEEFE